jgi:Bacterial Ig-like domain (group 2)
MSSTKNKLRLAGAFAALAALALAVSCTGFFQNPTVSSITIDPPNPSVGFGSGAASLQLTAAATFNDGSSSTLKGGTNCTGNTVCWSSSDTTVATITTGGMLAGVSAGTATITASSGSITGTTTATVAETVSSMTITPASSAITANGVDAAEFTITGVTSSGQQNISALITLTAEQGGVAVPNVVICVPSTDGSGNPIQSCIVNSDVISTAETYTMVVTYSGYTGTAQVAATLTVSP